MNTLLASELLARVKTRADRGANAQASDATWYDWICAAQREIVNKHLWWWRERTGTFTCDGNQGYSLDDLVGPIREVNYNGVPLRNLTIQQWDQFARASTATGTPTHWLLFGQAESSSPTTNRHKIYFIPTPSDGTVVYEYYASPPRSVIATDTFLVPDQWEDILVWGALKIGAAHATDANAAQLYRGEWAEVYADMLKEHHHMAGGQNPRLRSPRDIIGPSRSMKWPFRATDTAKWGRMGAH